MDYIENVADCATIKKMKTGDEYKMLYHYEYAIWTIEKKTLRIAVGICNNTDMPIVYMKDLQTEDYNCYSFYIGAITTEQAREIIDAAKNEQNRIVPHLIKRYLNEETVVHFYEDIGYAQLTDMVSDEWFYSVKSLVCLLDDTRHKGYYEIDVEVEEYGY